MNFTIQDELLHLRKNYIDIWFWCKGKIKENIAHIFLTELYFMLLVQMRWYSKTGTQYRYKLFYIRGVSDKKTL
ncbi:hypothetical protein IKE_05851 [Bacillus cereus VD196]|uniref:Uncharacterized protein n=1 Tax=Bacillus cereus VD196 TaxID=1053243 RepID=A0A9W5PYI1_BACCE|nr:hypothetical protein IKG_05472 [Bacillus cereus VD200]EOO61629.1 hypothetical protein IKE_05851 [Bacillus cereus VD196]